jgi:hypothetical protein
MITRWIVRWMRVVLPGSEMVWGCILGEMVIEAVYLLILARGWPADEAFFRGARIGWLSFSAWGYGISRIVRFHPALNEQYRKWLETTPWTADRPLPGGPIMLRPQDLIVMAALMGLARDSTPLVLTVPVGFLIGYLTTLAFAARYCGDWLFAYLIGMGLGAILLMVQSIEVCCLVAVSFCPIALVAIQRSLRLYPWDNDLMNSKAMQRQSNLEDRYRDRLGWPHDFLSPKAPKLMLPYHDGIGLSLLAGWYAFVIEFHGGMIIVCTYFSMGMLGAVLNRIVIYMKAHRWPIGLSGRFSTGRWIIPRYDVIYIAPVLAAIIIPASQWGAVAMVIWKFGRLQPFQQFYWPAAICSSLGIATASLLLLVMGPALERWRLAAPHRIVFDMTSRQSASPFVEL